MNKQDIIDFNLFEGKILGVTWKQFINWLYRQKRDRMFRYNSRDCVVSEFLNEKLKANEYEEYKFNVVEITVSFKTVYEFTDMLEKILLVEIAKNLRIKSEENKIRRAYNKKDVIESIKKVIKEDKNGEGRWQYLK